MNQSSGPQSGQPTLPSIPGALQTEHLSVAYGEREVLQDITLEIPQGRLTAIVGPNGAGKSTWLKAILGLIPLRTGIVRWPGLPPAVRPAYVPQRESIDWDFPAVVEDVVRMGTYSTLGWFRWPGQRERAATEQALQELGIADLRRRPIRELSGGEQQRTFLARALTQGSPILILDEPFQGVDQTTEAAIVRLLHTQRDQGKTIMVVHHDLATVPQYFDDVLLLNRRLIGYGRVDQVFTPQAIAATFQSRTQDSSYKPV